MKTVEMEVSVTHLMRIDATMSETMFEKLMEASKNKGRTLSIWDRKDHEVIDFIDTHIEEEMANEVSYKINSLREID